VQPTLSTIFSDDHSWVATLSGQRTHTLVVTGDVLLARHVNILIKQKNNPNWPFEKTKELLADADSTFINLETPLISNCPVIDSGFTFCGESTNVKGLVDAGIDVVNFANNHAGNFGEVGVTETVNLLRQNKLLVSGIEGPVYQNVDGVSFAFLGYNDIGIQPGVSHASKTVQMEREIQEAKKNSDIVVVQFHWGVEYAHTSTQRQRELAYHAIDQGADLIIGNHPHWYQGIEFYNNKLIMYSHGNFVFDQMWSQKTREGVVGKYTWYDKTLIDVEFIPILIEDYGQPRIITNSDKKQEVIGIMKNESMQYYLF
jgi:poly-gamma-glutamate synthesis protein (capsule biosynthesis protein)